MDDTGGPQDQDLAEQTRLQNSNLRRLIDAVGTLLAGSRELLKRLQPLSEGEPPNDMAQQQNDAPSPPQSPPSDEPPPANPKKANSEHYRPCGVESGHLHPAPPSRIKPQQLKVAARASRFRTSP